MEKDASTTFAIILAIVRIAITYMGILIMMLVGRNRGWNGKKIAMWSLIVAIILDPVDSLPGRMAYGISYAKSDIYQRADKIADIIIYGIILLSYLQYGDGDTSFTLFLMLTYIWRLIGTILFVATGWKGSLIMFPNLFVEPVILSVLLTEYLHVTDTFYWILMIVGIMLKVGYEYFHHKIWSKMTW